MATKLSRFAIIVALIAFTSACATFRNPSIADLKSHPGRYQDRSVNVSGVVTSSWGLPLVPFRMYKVDDGTGEVTVVSGSGGVPPKGARVTVKGKVNEFASFGGTSLGLHLRQEHLKFKGY